MHEPAAHLRDQQMKAGVLVDVACNFLRVRLRSDRAADEVADERSPGAALRCAHRAAEIRDGREPAAARDREPAAAVQPVASAEGLGRVGPEVGRDRRPLVVLVPVGRDDKRKLIRNPMCNDDQAHRSGVYDALSVF